MTLDEAKEAKAKAERAIEAAVLEFTEATGLRVDGVDLRTVRYTDIGSPGIRELVDDVRMLVSFH